MLKQDIGRPIFYKEVKKPDDVLMYQPFMDVDFNFEILLVRLRQLASVDLISGQV